MKKLQFILIFPLISIFFNIFSMDKIKSKLEKLKIIKTSVQKVSKAIEVSAQGDICLEGLELKTFGQLKEEEECLANSMCASKPQVSKWGNKIDSNALMVKVCLLQCKTNGLSEEQERFLWNTFPGWIKYEFLKELDTYLYQFKVKAIIPKPIPVELKLIKNPNHKKNIDPYDLLDHLQEEYKNQKTGRKTIENLLQ